MVLIFKASTKFSMGTTIYGSNHSSTLRVTQYQGPRHTELGSERFLPTCINLSHTVSNTSKQFRTKQNIAIKTFGSVCGQTQTVNTEATPVFAPAITCACTPTNPSFSVIRCYKFQYMARLTRLYCNEHL